MRISAAILGLAASVSGHAIFQKLSVNGVDQGALKGVRAPSSNNPIQNVNDGGFACNNNIQYKDSNVVSVPAGARVGAWWGHVIGGAQGSNDPDHPIAASHKGPIIVYLAKVDNAASTGSSNLQWFKIAEAGLSGSTWAVDTMISNGGWHYFTLPSCVAPGDYLLRVEIIALHGASVQGEAQFYMECAQIRVTGSGTNAGSNFVSFPGAYSASHPVPAAAAPPLLLLRALPQAHHLLTVAVPLRLCTASAAAKDGLEPRRAHPVLARPRTSTTVNASRKGP